MTPLDIESLREHHLSALERELLDDVVRLVAERDELTRQLDDARDKAINAGIFTSLDDDISRYTHTLNVTACETCGEPFKPWVTEGCCDRCETEISTPGATSYKP